ncbi:MAG: hypothetical protein V4850_12940 [Myxococcota bacterium]
MSSGSPWSTRRPALVALALFVVFAILFAPDAATGSGVFWHHDFRHHHYPWRAWAAGVWASGEVPWWAAGAGNGFPLLAEGEGGFLYPPTMLLFVLLPDALALNWSVLGHQVLAAMGVWAFLRARGLRGAAPLVGGLAYAWSGFLVSHTLYLGMQNAAAWVGWALLGATPRADGRGRWWLVALSIGMMGLAGHPQIAAFVGLGLAVHALATLRGRALLAWGAAAGLGGVIAAPQLLATLELVRFSGRDGGVAAAFARIGAMPVQELVGAVLPYAFGFDRPADIDQTYYHRGTGYWGGGVNHWEMCFYLGIPVVCLALAGARRSKGWVVAGIVATVLMLGGPAWDLVRLLPGFDGFRFPARFALLLTLVAAVLAAHGVERLRTARRPAIVVTRLRMAAAAFPLLTGLAYAGLHTFEAPILGIGEGFFLAQTRLPPPPEGFDPGPLARAALPAPELEDAAQVPNKVRRILTDLRASTAPTSPRVWIPVLLLLAASFAVRRPWLWGALVAFELWRFGHDYHPRVPAAEVEVRPAWLGEGMTEPGGPRLTVLDRRVAPALDTALGTASLGLLWGTSDVVLPSPLLLVRNEAMLALAGLDVGDRGPVKVRRYLANIGIARRLGVRWIATTHELPGLTQLVRGPVNVYLDPGALPRVRVVTCARSSASVDDAFTRVATTDPLDEVVVEGVGEDRGCAARPVASDEGSPGGGAPPRNEPVKQSPLGESGEKPESPTGAASGAVRPGWPGGAPLGGTGTGPGTRFSAPGAVPGGTGGLLHRLNAPPVGAGHPPDPPQPGIDVTRGAGEGTDTETRGAAMATPGASLPPPATVVAYADREVTVRASGPGTLVLADTWYPRWTATVDGVATEILRADVTVRAVPLSEGEHTVVFRFDPGVPGVALWLAVGVLAGVVAVGVREGRRA